MNAKRSLDELKQFDSALDLLEIARDQGGEFILFVKEKKDSDHLTCIAIARAGTQAAMVDAANDNNDFSAARALIAMRRLREELEEFSTKK